MRTSGMALMRNPMAKASVEYLRVSFSRFMSGGFARRGVVRRFLMGLSLARWLRVLVEARMVAVAVMAIVAASIRRSIVTMGAYPPRRMVWASVRR